MMVKLLAFYLPQFHTIPENDTWWGKGFTDWTNVARAKPLFRGHYQPHIPADLGFYDLRVPEVREAQADLAREYGIHGFCYYHYWFHGQRLLHRPLDEVLASGRPDFPFCLCWANESWTRAWDGRTSDILVEQTYSEQDDIEHIRWLAGVFEDNRYIRYQGKPVFLIYRASQMKDPLKTTSMWRQEARRLGIGELLLARVESMLGERTFPWEVGCDVGVEFQPNWSQLGPPLHRERGWRLAAKVGLGDKAYQSHRIYQYSMLMERALQSPSPGYPRFRCVTPSWDNSPRREQDAVVFHGSTPALYEQWLAAVIDRDRALAEEDRLLFINAWNEWGEGNHLEPDLRYGHAYLEATKRALRERK